MIVPLTVAFIVGTVAGGAALWGLLGNDRIKMRAMAKVLQASADGWLLILSGGCRNRCSGGAPES